MNPCRQPSRALRLWSPEPLLCDHSVSQKAVSDEAKKRRLRSGETIRKRSVHAFGCHPCSRTRCVLKNLIWLERWQLDEVAKPAAESSFDRTQVFAAGLIAALNVTPIAAP